MSTKINTCLIPTPKDLVYLNKLQKSIFLSAELVYSLYINIILD